VTPDGGETWVDRPEGSRRDTHALATHPDAPDRVYAAAGDGFAESHDRGDSWRVVDRGLGHGYVWGLAVDPGDPETALVSAASGARAAHSRGEASLYRRASGTMVGETAMRTEAPRPTRAPASSGSTTGDPDRRGNVPGGPRERAGGRDDVGGAQRGALPDPRRRRVVRAGSRGPARLARAGGRAIE